MALWRRASYTARLTSMHDTVADEIARGLTRPRRSGCPREQELDVLARV